MEIIQVFLVDLPGTVRAFTVHNSDDSYTIFINAGLSHEMQCAAYDHEMQHINNHDFDYCYDVNELENERHSA
jgi:hypothetical protein